MAGEEQKKEGKGFTVQDRRRFSPETGESRQRSDERTEDSGSGSQGDRGAEKQAATGAAAQSTEHDPRPEGPLPEINFSTFVISLSTQALMHLGEMANPLTGKLEPDTEVAKQMIDIIGMLREKARGNLDAGEERLMEDILFDLRMRYVEAVRKRQESRR